MNSLCLTRNDLDNTVLRLPMRVLFFDWIAGSSQVITLGEYERGASKGTVLA